MPRSKRLTSHFMSPLDLPLTILRAALLIWNWMFTLSINLLVALFLSGSSSEPPRNLPGSWVTFRLVPFEFELIEWPVESTSAPKTATNCTKGAYCRNWKHMVCQKRRWASEPEVPNAESEVAMTVSWPQALRRKRVENWRRGNLHLGCRRRGARRSRDLGRLKWARWLCI